MQIVGKFLDTDTFIATFVLLFAVVNWLTFPAQLARFWAIVVRICPFIGAAAVFLVAKLATFNCARNVLKSSDRSVSTNAKARLIFIANEAAF